MVLLGGIGIAVLWPVLYADFGRDDYFQRAFLRLLDSPWPLFVQDHFPVPAAVFRPLGYASMWWEVQAFPPHYGWHYSVQMALHLGTAVVLWRTLRALQVSALPAWIATAAWTLHPVAVGTTLWWSARFDGLATLGVLAALLGAIEWRAHGRRRALCGTLLATLAAMLSKEIGLLAVPAVLAVWWAAPWLPARRHARWHASAGVLGTALLYLGWRAWVLGTGGSGLLGEAALLDTLVRGLWVWVQQAPGYFSYGAGGASLSLPLLGCGVLMTLLARRAGRLQQDSAADLGIAAWIAATCLVLLPALLQAPVAALNAAPLTQGMSAVEAAMQSRLYLLGLVGWALLLGLTLQWSWPHVRGGAGVLACALLLTGIGLWGYTSHTQATEYAARTRANAVPAQAAMAALQGVDLPAQGCHLRYTGLTPPPEWDVYVSMDSVLKALATDEQLQALARCWVWTDWPTWFHVVPVPVGFADAWPATPRLREGIPIAWQRVGSATYAYLSLVTADQLAVGVHWHWDGRAFVPLPGSPSSPLTQPSPP